MRAGGGRPARQARCLLEMKRRRRKGVNEAKDIDKNVRGVMKRGGKADEGRGTHGIKELEWNWWNEERAGRIIGSMCARG